MKKSSFFIFIVLSTLACRAGTQPSPISPTSPTTINATPTAKIESSAPTVIPVATEPIPLPTDGSIGFLGCSFSNNAVEGYQMQGGERFWEVTPPYNAGIISVWAEGVDKQIRYWDAFHERLNAHADTQTLWWQLCNNKLVPDDRLYEDSLVVLSELRQILPNVVIYASGQHSYSDGHDCPLDQNTDGPERMQALVDRLVAEGLVMAGPRMGPLAKSQTVDGCHANRDGKLLLGKQLLEFFDQP